MRRSSGGDGDAFLVLVERHQAAVFTLVQRMVRSREEAEEIAQDVSVRAWKALPSFRGDARFSTWLYRIAIRRATDAAVRARRRAAHERPLGDTVADAAPQVGAGPVLGRSRFRLERLIRDLPLIQRVAVTLYYYEGRKVDEVAEAMEVPQGTVKTLLFRARAALRRAWLEETAREDDDELRRL